MSDAPRYRLYRFDSSGHITSFKELDCRSDLDAIEQARKLVAREPQELWSGKRKLAVIQSQSAAQVG
jgi:hypothetical protein